MLLTLKYSLMCLFNSSLSAYFSNERSKLVTTIKMSSKYFIRGSIKNLNYSFIIGILSNFTKQNKWSNVLPSRLSAKSYKYYSSLFLSIFM